MEVLISNTQDQFSVDLDFIKDIAIEIMKFEGCSENSELSLVFCDDDFIQKLNNDYLGKNEPTDVLSFPLEDDGFGNEIKPIGDIVISTETAIRQAANLKHETVFEIVFLLIHGLLHLAGYDHMKVSDRKVMREREVSICQHLCDKKLLGCMDVKKVAPLIKRVIEED